MKKIVVWIAIVSMLLGLTACGQQATQSAYPGTMTELVEGSGSIQGGPGQASVSQRITSMLCYLRRSLVKYGKICLAPRQSEGGPAL